MRSPIPRLTLMLVALAACDQTTSGAASTTASNTAGTPATTTPAATTTPPTTETPPPTPTICGPQQERVVKSMTVLSGCAADVVAKTATTCDKQRGEFDAASEEYTQCISTASGSGNAMDDAIDKMTGFADSMCKCPDKVCADKVTEEMMKFAETMSKSPIAKQQPETPEQKKKVEALTARLTECMMKTMTADTPPP